MSRIKVLGIGSPYGDDQAGWKAAELLAQRAAIQSYAPDMLCIEIYDRPGMRLLDYWQGENIVYIIDAVVSGGAIGAIHRFQNMEIEEAQCIVSSHEMGVAQALQIGRALNQLPENIIFYGVEILQAAHGRDISSSVARAVCHLVARVEAEITRTLAGLI
ncbi:hypothetical protein AQUSIP_08290 [Aquicella siphonis]|uniref:Hydrogenase maturation protease n=1 Tax=Aquicella siphonis TaxID=254247 RepID=A0A5E4PEX5_9COXI|nr:hydrogenase maturation protease [Aquicella siphonis]VVC75539.1 hypothetical protein AQUSIP_08290 [Aquicella siphonis]